MTSDFGVPEVAQTVCHEDLVAALMAVIRDVANRATALEVLIASAQPVNSISSGRVTPDVEARAWFAAVKAAQAPRPALTPIP